MNQSIVNLSTMKRENIANEKEKERNEKFTGLR
jgi:hypothetical protein